MLSTTITLLVDAAGDVQSVDAAGDVLIEEEALMASSTTNYSGSIQVINTAPAAAVDGSGVITLGGHAQLVFGATAPANGFLVCNNSTFPSPGPLFVTDIGTALAGGNCIEIAQGATFITPSGYKPAGAVSIFGGMTGQSFAARRW